MLSLEKRYAKYAAAVLAAALALALLCAVGLPVVRARTFPDIGGQPAEIQAAIDYVSNKGYMGAAADGNFHPNDGVARIEYAYIMMLVFKKTGEQIDPNIHFTDIGDSDPYYAYANIATKCGFMGRYPDGSFRPYEPSNTLSSLMGLEKGMGLDEPWGPVWNAASLWLRAPAYSGQSIVANDLHLKYRNTRTIPTTMYPRGELAYSIQRAEQCESWRLDYVRSTFNWLSCQRPLAGTLRGAALDNAFAKIGYPYVWGGESDAEGGYDCSGLTYFVLRSALGFSMQRTADAQAKDGRYAVVSRQNLLPGDPIFFFSDPSTSDYVGHAGMYVGRGLFIHSTGSNAGVSVDYLTGYWSNNFAWGRRVIPEPEPESFDTYILLCNPTGSTAQARLTYMLQGSLTTSEVRTIEPYSRKSVKVDDTLVQKDFATTVEALQGQVVAERAMYFRYKDAYPGGHTSPGTTSPATEWFLAEGCTAYGIDTYVLIQNPNAESTDVTVTFMKEDGSSTDLRFSVWGSSRHTVDVRSVPGMENAEFSTRVSASRPISVERSMYFYYNGVADGHNSQGLTQLSSDWHFAEGYTPGLFDTYVLLANPSEAQADVTMTLMGDDGGRSDVDIAVGAYSRRTVAIDRIEGWSDRAFSVSIHSNLPIAAERAMYFAEGGKVGGHDTIGCTAPGTRWYLAEGYTGGSFDTYVLISNPGGEPANVFIRFMLNGGRFLDKGYAVGAHSRYTIHVDEQAGLAAEEVSAIISSDKPIVVERSMYFSYMGRPGGSCSPAVPAAATKWYFAEGYTGR